MPDMTEHPASPLLDLPKALTLVSDDKMLLGELAAVFLEELPAQLEALEAATGRGDATGIRDAAHRLKGALANLAATGPLQLAYELEVLGRTGALEGAPVVLRALKDQLARLVELLTLPDWIDHPVK